MNASSKGEGRRVAENPHRGGAGWPKMRQDLDVPRLNEDGLARFLITGGCGFIGSHLVASLVGDGHAVTVLDDLSRGRSNRLPSQVDLVVGDVADLETVRSALAEADGCFHLAAQADVQESVSDWLGTHRANVTGTVTVFEAIREARRRIPVVYASSAFVYGDTNVLPVPVPETERLRPMSPYTADKVGSESHATAAWYSHGLPSIRLRIFNVYGPVDLTAAGEQPGVVAAFVGRLQRREPITVYGQGDQLRDFIYVADVVNHLRAAMGRSVSDALIYNVCTGRPTSIVELARLLADLLEPPLAIRSEPKRAGDIQASIDDPAAAFAALGLSADISIEEGLRCMIHGSRPATTAAAQ